MTIPDPYGRAQFHGRLGDNATIAMLEEAERKLGYELTIIQFIGGAPASSGTHFNGRMADLAAYDWRRKLRVIFDLGGYGWYRPFRAGVWPAHLHIGSIFESRSNRRGIADLGFRQIGMWDNKRDGLVSNDVDFFDYRPSPKNVWTMAEYEAKFVEKREVLKPTPVQQVRNELVTSIHNLADAISKMSDVHEGRLRVHALAQPLIEERRHLKEILAKMPKK